MMFPRIQHNPMANRVHFDILKFNKKGQSGIITVKVAISLLSVRLRYRNTLNQEL